MTPAAPRILCIGQDEPLLQSRCAVLASSGYEAFPVLIPDAFKIMAAIKFELVIMSASSFTDPAFSAAIPPDTQILLLDGLIVPSQLLSMTEHRIGASEKYQSRMYGAEDRTALSATGT